MSTATVPARALAPRSPMLLALVLGPVATVVALLAGHTVGSQTFLGAAPLGWYIGVALLAWSPLPFSIPAALLEDARDAALPGYTGLGRLVRAVRFIPHMLQRSPARVEFLASLVGFALAVVVAWPSL